MTREERDKAIKHINDILTEATQYDDSVCYVTSDDADALKAAIKALEQEPKTGHWIEIAKYSDGKHKIECSECGSHIFDRGHANSFNVKNKYKYCPNCGARMIEPQESERE